MKSLVHLREEGRKCRPIWRVGQGAWFPRPPHSGRCPWSLGSAGRRFTAWVKSSGWRLLRSLAGSISIERRSAAPELSLIVEDATQFLRAKPGDEVRLCWDPADAVPVTPEEEAG